MIRVSSLEDDRISDYRDLREAHLAARHHAFIAESEVVLRVLLRRSIYPIRSILIAEPRIEKLRDALESCDPAVPIYVAEQELLDDIVGFHIHRGILAAGQRTPVPSPKALLEQLGDARRVVLLESLTNHDNVGGIFRNAAAFGTDAVLIDTPTCDPLYRKSIRVGVGAPLFVPFARAVTSAENIAALKSAGFTLVALSPRRDAVDIADYLKGKPAPERVALMLGTEGEGLTETSVAAADMTVRIPMAPGFDSLNVATTSGIALHAFRKGGEGQVMTR
jgi:tRNA G18 (ribose-2'-O)-methylase SpoU